MAWLEYTHPINNFDLSDKPNITCGSTSWIISALSTTESTTYAEFRSSWPKDPVDSINRTFLPTKSVRDWGIISGFACNFVYKVTMLYIKTIYS